MIGLVGTVYEPGRLPTLHFADGFTGPSALPTTSSGITIIDGGGRLSVVLISRNLASR